jgi:hypothetical protein
MLGGSTKTNGLAYTINVKESNTFKEEALKIGLCLSEINNTVTYLYVYSFVRQQGVIAREYFQPRMCHVQKLQVVGQLIDSLY